MGIRADNSGLFLFFLSFGFFGFFFCSFSFLLSSCSISSIFDCLLLLLSHVFFIGLVQLCLVCEAALCAGWWGGCRVCLHFMFGIS